jgi:hypothetical protein
MLAFLEDTELVLIVVQICIFQMTAYLILEQKYYFPT